MDQLVTGEAVVLDLRTAATASRLLARALDAVVQGVAFALLMLLVGAATPSSSAAAVAGFTVLVLVTVLLGYPIACEALTRGRTLGKLALGLRVVRDDGGAVGFRHALVRGLVGGFAENPGITFGSAAVISSLLSERGKRLGDLLAGTVVVQERVAVPRTQTMPMPPGLAGWAAALDLSRLPDDLAESARSYLARYAALTAQAQQELGGRLASAVAQRVAPPPPDGVPAWAYLQAVLAERSRRATASASVPPAPARRASPQAADVPAAAAAHDLSGGFAPPA